MEDDLLSLVPSILALIIISDDLSEGLTTHSIMLIQLNPSSKLRAQLLGRA
jgi:hypothetical protein